MSLPNPECTNCGDLLSEHRLQNDGGVRCLIVQPTKKDIEHGIQPVAISSFDRLHGNAEAERLARSRMAAGRLVQSPLSYTSAALEWASAVYANPRTPTTNPADELFGGVT